MQHYKRLIAWRNELAPLRSKVIAPVPGLQAPPTVEAYLRERLLVVVNLGRSAVSMNVPAPFHAVVRSTNDGVRLAEGRLLLPPYTTALLE